MNSKVLIRCLLFMFISNGLFAQQVGQYTQWAFHQFALNPAHAGIKSCLDVHTLFRTQWVGLDGAPRNGLLTFCIPLKAKRKEFLSARHGFGMRFESDRIGQFTTNRFSLAYAGHFNFSRDTRLSLGLYGGIIQMSYSPNGSVTIQPDPQIVREANVLAPDATFGAWWNGKNYYAGMVIQNMLRHKWEAPGTQSYFRPHLLLNGGYRITINKQVTFVPAILFKVAPNTPWVVDFQANFNFKNSLDLGTGFRNGDALFFFAGIKLNQKFTLIYSYDITTSYLRNYSSNTHEISLTFNTCRPEKSASVQCPLFE
jgi:type IX secretion system PorP/SprF family membrane protein